MNGKMTLDRNPTAIESGVRAKQDEKDPKAEKRANPASTSMQRKA